MDIHDVLNDSNPVSQIKNYTALELQPISADPFVAIRHDFTIMVQRTVSKLNEYMAADPFRNVAHVAWNNKSIKKDPRAPFGLRQPVEPLYRMLANHDQRWLAQTEPSEYNKMQREIPTHNTTDLLFFNHLFGAAHTFDEYAHLAETVSPLDMALEIHRYKRQQTIFCYLEGAVRLLWALHAHPQNQFAIFQQQAREFVNNGIPLTVHNIATLIAQVFFTDYNLKTVIRLWYTDQPITGQELKPYL